MNTPDTQKAIELIEKSEQIALLLPMNPSFDCTTAAEALFAFLESKQKYVGLLYDPSLPPHYQELPIQNIARAKPLLKEFVISVDTTHTPVAELRYEREAEHIDIILSPKLAPVLPETISLREGKVRCDIAITLGIKNIEEVLDATEIKADFFTETPFINIDNSPKNTRFGDANIILDQKSSLSEVIYDFLITAGFVSLNSALATTLLGGVIHETNNFSRKHTNADTLLAASELMRIGGDRAASFQTTESLKNVSLLQLFGRAAVRSRLDPTQKYLFSFLTQEDFEKTGESVKNIPFILEKLSKEFCPPSGNFLFFQPSGEEKVLIACLGTIPFLEDVGKHTGDEVIDKRMSIAKPFSTFREAEEHISQLLADII